MDPVSLLASTIAIVQLASKVGAACFHYAQGVRRAESEADNVIIEIRKFEDSLRDLSALLQDERLHGDEGHDRLLHLGKALSSDDIWLKDCRDDLETLLSKLEVDEQEPDLKRHAKVLLNRLKWPLKQEEVRRLLANMRRVRKTIQWSQDLDNLVMTREIDNRTVRIENKIDSIDATSRKTNAAIDGLRNADELRDLEQEGEAAKNGFLSWLTHADPGEEHILAADAWNKNANTGKWFMNGEKYNRFKHMSPSLLWLHGAPGSGKTILAASAIEDIKESLKADANTALAFWYFSTNDKKRTSFDQCIRALLSQLVRYSVGKLPSAINSLWLNKGKNGDMPNISDLTTTLIKLVSEENTKLYLVLDALDEIRPGDLNNLLKLLQCIQELDNTDIHILVTSRVSTKVDFQKRYKATQFFDVPMLREDVGQDIRLHIKEKLKSDPSLNKWDHTMQKLILDTLERDADGMFRWVDCQLAEIRQCCSKADVKKTLRELPATLQDQYRRDLRRITSKHKARWALSILRFMAFPQRRLRLEEAAEIVAVDLDEERFDDDDKLEDPYVILKLCGSLVRIDEVKVGSHHLGEYVHGKYLTTSHNTVLDFLRSEELQVGPLQPEGFNPAAVNYKLAKSCLIYLRWLFNNDKVPILNKVNLVDYPCASFCAEYFDDYIRAALEDSQASADNALLDRMLINIMDDKKSLLKLVQLCDPDSNRACVNFDIEPDKLQSPLYYASLYGLPGVLQHYIDQGQNVNQASTNGYGTALVAAAARGSQSCLDILLASGADASLSSTCYWGTPLAAATQGNHVDIVRTLLRQPGVDVNGARHRFTNPGVSSTWAKEAASQSMVYIATVHKSSEVLEILLDHKAHVDTPGGRFHTALQAACFYDDESIVNTLLDHGASVSKYGGLFDNALYAACAWGCAFTTETYSRLINSDIDIDRNMSSLGPESPYYDKGLTYNMSVLCGAAAHLSPPILELLLLKGANVNARDNALGGTPLQVACANGKTENARLLLAHGADPALQGTGTLPNCMAAAAFNGHAEIVDVLLKEGVSPNMKGGALWYPLIMACDQLDSNNEEASVETVKLLLDAGADVNPTIDEGDWMGISPISMAAHCSSPITSEVIKTLIRHGANVNPPYAASYATPLGQAIMAQNIETVALLLHEGADLHPAGHEDMLGWAISKSENLGIIKLLLNASDVSALNDNEHGTALHAAAETGTVEIVQLLLDAGADPNRVHWIFGSVLQGAAVNNVDRTAMVRMLHKHVTMKDATNMIGQNVLLYALCRRAFDSAEELLAIGYDLKFSDNRLANGLHYAAASASETFVHYAIKAAVDVNLADIDGWTPLHYAAASTLGSSEVITALLEAGADRSVQDHDGLTPADLAYSFDKPVELSLLLGKKIPNIIHESYRYSPWKFSVWEDAYCDACGDSRGTMYTCDYCEPTEFWFAFCFHCFLRRSQIHPVDHDEWTRTEYVLQTRPTPSGSYGTETNKIIYGLSRYDQTIACLNSEIDDGITTVLYTVEGEAVAKSISYFEIAIHDMNETAGARLETSYIFVGVVTLAMARTYNDDLGTKLGSWGYCSYNGCLYTGKPTGLQYGETFGPGDTIGCGIDESVNEFDRDLRALFFTKNGKHLGSFLILSRDKLVPFFHAKGSKVDYDFNLGEKPFAWKGEP